MSVLALGHRGADQLRYRAGRLQVGLVRHPGQHVVPGSGEPAREQAAAIHHEGHIEIAACDGDRDLDFGEAVPGVHIGGSLGLRHVVADDHRVHIECQLVIGAELAVRARAAGFAFRAVVADSAYGDQDGFRAGLAEAGLPFVMALRPHRGTWARAADAHTPVDAARALAWGGPDDPGDWTAVRRTFRDGHAETWRAADAKLGGWGPDGARRLVVATADPATLPGKATWYLVTNLPRPGGPREAGSPHPAASLAEIVRLYAIRNWIEQSYKQVKDELGWADFQVRSDLAIRRHQALVNCAFSFCWDAWFADQPDPSQPAAPQPGPGRRERGASRSTAGAILAAGAARSPRLARPVDHAAALVARLVQSASAPAAASPDQLGRGRLRPAPLHPELTDYR